MEVVDKYTTLKAFYEVIDQVNGLPKGTTPVGALSFEELRDMADELARCAGIIQWGLIATCGALMQEFPNKTNVRTLRYSMKTFPYAWGVPISQVPIIRNMLLAGADIDVTGQPDVCYTIWHDKNTELSDEEKRTLWIAARTRRWGAYMVKDIVSSIKSFKKLYPEHELSVVQMCIEAAQKRCDIVSTDVYKKLAAGDVSGEGAGPGEDQPTE